MNLKTFKVEVGVYTMFSPMPLSETGSSSSSVDLFQLVLKVLSLQLHRTDTVLVTLSGNTLHRKK